MRHSRHDGQAFTGRIGQGGEQRVAVWSAGNNS